MIILEIPISRFLFDLENSNPKESKNIINKSKDVCSSISPDILEDRENFSKNSEIEKDSFPREENGMKTIRKTCTFLIQRDTQRQSPSTANYYPPMHVITVLFCNHAQYIEIHDLALERI